MPVSFAPIILFAYKRLNTLKRTVDSLQHNMLKSESELFIFSDAAKTGKDVLAVEEVRAYLETISGFKSIRILEAKENKELANSIIEGGNTDN